MATQITVTSAVITVTFSTDEAETTTMISVAETTVTSTVAETTVTSTVAEITVTSRRCGKNGNIAGGKNGDVCGGNNGNICGGNYGNIGNGNGSGCDVRNYGSIGGGGGNYGNMSISTLILLGEEYVRRNYAVVAASEKERVREGEEREVYGRVERKKKRQLIELEKPRMEFAKEIECKRMQMVVET